MSLMVSGVAENLERPPYSSFTVEEGPFYESELQDFLNANPGSTKADFKSPVFSMKGAVCTFPTETTAIYNIIASVREMKELTFAGKEFYKMLIPVGRSTSGEEILGYICAVKGICRDIIQKVGTDISITAWMCVDCEIEYQE